MKPPMPDPLHLGEFGELARRVAAMEHENSQLQYILQRHYNLAADARCWLHNGGYGPNSSQIDRVSKALAEIAGLPPEARP